MEILVLQQPHEISFSGNPIPFTLGLTPYGYPEQQQDIRIQVSLHHGLSLNAADPTYQEIWSQVLIPNSGGKVDIDVASVCDAYLKWHTPRLSLQQIIRAPEQAKNFQLLVRTLINGQPLGAIKRSDPFTVLKGGIAYEKFHPSAFFTNHLAAKKPLHFFPEKDIVSPTEKRFMYFVPTELPIPLEPMKIRIKIYEADGSSGTYTSNEFSPCMKYTVFIAPLGFRQIIDLLPSEPITTEPVKYEVSIITDNRTVVEPVTLWLDYRNEYNKTSLLYRNSLGAMDNIRILGEMDFQAEYDSVNAQQTPPPSGVRNALVAPHFINADITEQEKTIGATGFLSKDRLHHLRDILLSRNIYEVRENKMLPVYLNKRTVKFYQSRDNLFSMMFEWMKAYVNTHFTPEGAFAVPDTCPAVKVFQVKQLTKNQLHILWSLPMPYDHIEIEITNGTTEDNISLVLLGNTGAQTIRFNNPNPETNEIVVKARVVCDVDTVPMSTGAWTTVELDVFENLSPIAMDDILTIESGYNTPQVLSGNVLANDYDPDFDPIQVVADTGSTAEGGTYAISAAGVVTYTPPASNFNGEDYFDYTIEEVANPLATATARCRIHVGNMTLGMGTYVKMIERNHYAVESAGIRREGGDFFITFWQDPLGTIPKLMPVPAGYTKVRVKFIAEKDMNLDDIWDPDGEETRQYIAVGNEMHVYSGQTFIRVDQVGVRWQKRLTFSILAHVPDDGELYIPI